MTDPDTQLMAAAFNGITDVLAKIHSEFKTMAYSVVLLLMMVIAGCTCFILGSVSRTEERLLGNQERMLILMRNMSDGFQMHQNVNVAPGRTFNDNVRDVLIKRGDVHKE